MGTIDPRSCAAQRWRAVLAMRRCRVANAGGCLLLAMSITAHGVEIETGNPDVKVHWDNTVAYTAAWRVRQPSATLIDASPTAINQDDGDRSFRRGLVTSRFDLYSEIDVSYRNFGVRASGAAWNDDVYNHANDNDSPFTFNPVSVPHDRFTGATRDLLGRHAEWLDYFVFGKADLGTTSASFRAGNHALVWGESLFLGANGIAGAQQPVDIVKLLSVPNTPFRELIRPVGQVSGQLQITSEIAVAAYYQYHWDKTRLPAAGSYFSTIDVLDAGGERLIVGAPLVEGGGPAAFFRGADRAAKDGGQWGVQLKIRHGPVDYGLYAVRYHDKTPQIYLRPSVLQLAQAPPIVLDPSTFNPLAGEIGTYSLVYPENVDAYGASFSTAIEEVNIAGEISMRRHTPLVSDPQVVPPGTIADADRHALYAVGNSLHAQLSWIWQISPNALSRESSLVGEVGWNRRMSITKNPAALDPNVTRDAWALRLVYEAKYRQVLPGLDLSVPIGIGYNPSGNSSVVANFNGGAEHGGDVTIGVNGAYLDRWRFGLSYTHYFGPAGAFLDANNFISGKQSLADRDFVALTLRTTF
jgi:hypothetical protein